MAKGRRSLIDHMRICGNLMNFYFSEKEKIEKMNKMNIEYDNTLALPTKQQQRNDDMSGENR